MSTALTDDLEKSTRKESVNWFRSVILPLGALLLALCAQWLLLETETNSLIAAFLFVVAITFYLLMLCGWPQAALWPEPMSALNVSWRPIIKSRSWRGALLINALSLATISYRWFDDNALDNGLEPWLGAIALFLIASICIPDCDIREFFAACATWIQTLDRRGVLLLALVLLLAIIFRFFRLQEIPLEMTSDHAEKLLDVQDVLDGSRPIFFPRNSGREPFQFYLTAGLIRLTGLPISHLSLKIGTAIFGVLAVPFTYLLGRLLYGQFVGLAAAFFLAVSHWHVVITRVGLRFPFTAAFAVPTLFFLLRALRDNKRNDWLLAALFLGVGLHTYTAMRIVPLLFMVLVGLKLLFDGIKKLSKQPIEGANAWSGAFWKNGALAFFFTVLLFLPLLRIMVDDPLSFWVRSLSRAQADAAPTTSELAIQFFENMKNAMLMFNVQGDAVPMNTIPHDPVLGLVSGALFVLGGAYLVWRLFVGKDRRSVFLLVSLFFLILPSILSLAFPDENPSVARTGGAVPIVMIIAAIPLASIATRLQTSQIRVGDRVATLVVSVLILVAIAGNYIWYFEDYDQHIRYSLWNSTELGAVLKAFEDDGANVANAFQIVYSHWADTRNIGINAGHVRWNNAITDRRFLKSHVGEPRPRLYLLHPDDLESLRMLQDLFPDGNKDRYNSPNEGRDFIIFHVPAK